MAEQKDRENTSSRAVEAHVLAAWVIYYLLKCILVFSVMHFGEHLGFPFVSLDQVQSLQELWDLNWGSLAVYYSSLAVVGALLFKLTVNRFVILRMCHRSSSHLSLFIYFRVWLVYAIITFAGGLLVSQILEHIIQEVMLGDLADASWLVWLHESVRPMVFTVVSLMVFRWAVFTLLSADKAVVPSTNTSS